MEMAVGTLKDVNNKVMFLTFLETLFICGMCIW